MRLRYLFSVFALAFLLMIFPKKAHASTINDDLRLTLYFGSQTYDFGHANLTNGVEFQSVANGAFDLDVSANQIIVTFLQDRGFGNATNIYTLTNLTNAFASASLDSSTTAPFTHPLFRREMVGFHSA